MFGRVLGQKLACYIWAAVVIFRRGIIVLTTGKGVVILQNGVLRGLVRHHSSGLLQQRILIYMCLPVGFLACLACCAFHLMLARSASCGHL